MWTSSLRLLDERPWVELYHLSPLDSWQQVIAFVGGHAHRFPEHPTRAHEDALALMLQLQQPCGQHAGSAEGASRRVTQGGLKDGGGAAPNEPSPRPSRILVVSC